jgi:PTH1 family peptidyl-tRNA hydrolase
MQIMTNQHEKITAIIGLGNPGNRFNFTRHNAGFMVVDALADAHGGIWQEKGNMAVAEIEINNHDLMLVKPLTFMNNSGAIMAALAKRGIKADNILVVHDELEKPFGTLAIKAGGSHRGHNGLRSIIGSIGPDFLRLRFGIGRPEDKNRVGDYVLERFSEKKEDVQRQVDAAVRMIEELVHE